jgi:hypothetical protein
VHHITLGTPKLLKSSPRFEGALQTEEHSLDEFYDKLHAEVLLVVL